MAVLFIHPVRIEGQSERLLLAAIIRRSAYDIALYKGSTRLEKRVVWRDAYTWMMSDQDDHFTSFVSICNLLDQDPNDIRRKTMLLTRQDVKRYDMVDSHGRL